MFLLEMEKKKKVSYNCLENHFFCLSDLWASYEIVVEVKNVSIFMIKILIFLNFAFQVFMERVQHLLHCTVF